MAGVQSDNVFRLKNDRQEYCFEFEKKHKEVTWSVVINERPGLKKIKKGKNKTKVMCWYKIWRYLFD